MLILKSIGIYFICLFSLVLLNIMIYNREPKFRNLGIVSGFIALAYYFLKKKKASSTSMTKSDQRYRKEEQIQHFSNQEEYEKWKSENLKTSTETGEGVSATDYSQPSSDMNPNQSGEYTAINQDEERLYEIAAREIQDKKVSPGLMAKAFSECDGDEKKATSRYIKYRVSQLQQKLVADMERLQKQQEENRKAEARRKAEEELQRRQRPLTASELDIMRKICHGNNVLIFAFADGEEWVCVCGSRNQYDRRKKYQNCQRCHRNRDFILQNCTREAFPDGGKIFSEANS